MLADSRARSPEVESHSATRWGRGRERAGQGTVAGAGAGNRCHRLTGESRDTAELLQSTALLVVWTGLVTLHTGLATVAGLPAGGSR